MGLGAAIRPRDESIADPAKRLWCNRADRDGCRCVTVRWNGAAVLEPAWTSWSPAGTDTNESVTVCGLRRTLSVSVRPPESVAVSRSSR